VRKHPRPQPLVDDLRHCAALADDEANWPYIQESLFEAADRIAQLEAAAEKVHGIIAEYWGPCMGSVESLLTLREAVGARASTWLPKVSDLPRASTLETKGEQE